MPKMKKAFFAKEKEKLEGDGRCVLPCPCVCGVCVCVPELSLWHPSCCIYIRISSDSLLQRHTHTHTRVHFTTTAASTRMQCAVIDYYSYTQLIVCFHMCQRRCSNTTNPHSPFAIFSGILFPPSHSPP